MPEEPLASGSETVVSRAGGFPLTHWSVVLAARGGDDTRATTALETLCRAYWYPLYAFVRRQGYGPEDAQDLTQGFFARFLEKRFLDEVDPGKGRFRSFLLAALRHFVSNERNKQRTLKRGGASHVLSLDREFAENRYRFEPAHGVTPEKLYQQAWASVLLERVLNGLRKEYEAADKGFLFDAIQVYLEGERGQAPYSEVGRQLGLGESAMKMSVLRLRRRYAELLRLEIAHTVADPAEVEEEIRALFAAVE